MRKHQARAQTYTIWELGLATATDTAEGKYEAKNIQ